MRWLENTRLSTRVALGACTCVIAIAVVAVVAQQAVRIQSGAMQRMSIASRVQRYHQDADMYHEGLRASVYASLLEDNAARQTLDTDREVQVQSEAFHRDLEQLSALSKAADFGESLGKVRIVAERYIAAAHEITEISRTDRNKALSRISDFDREFENLKTLMDRQTRMIADYIASTEERAQIEVAAATRMIVYVLIGSGVFILGVLWSLLASVLRRLSSIRDVASAMAQGDLSRRTGISSQDEIGQLAVAVDQTAERLADLIGKVRADAGRDAFGTQLVEALEMVDTEREVYQIVGRAMSEIAPDRPMELLVADSSQAQLERAIQHPQAGAPGCTVESPFSCVAVRRGNPVTFADSEALNACPRLRGRDSGAVSAVCVPISFMGHSLGVLHTTGPSGQLPSAEQIWQLTTLGIQAGSRIGTVRAFERTQLQAATDSLTGLANRRSFEEVVRTLSAGGTTYSLVMCDLDHFKRLNDTYGHEAGDRALRTFAEVMREILRPEDHVARWGGEEFAIVMPGTVSSNAVKVIDRLRALLAERIVVSGVTPFTASFGVADTHMSTRFDELVRIADDALYRSKQNGRDQATIGNPLIIHTKTPRRTTDHDGAIDSARLSKIV